MQIIADNIEALLPYLLVLNVVLYIYSAIKVGHRSLRYLTIYLILVCCVELYVTYLNSHQQNNLYMIHIYLMTQFLSLSWFYKSLFIGIQKKLVNFLMILVTVLISVYYLFWPEDFAYFNLPEILITTVPVLAYILIHLYNSLTTKGDYLYFSGGLLIYLSISSLVFILYSLLANDLDNLIVSEKTSRNVAIINMICYFMLQVVIFIEWKLNISKWRAKKV